MTLAEAAAEADALAQAGDERALATLRSQWDEEIEAGARDADYRVRAQAYRAIAQFRFRQKLELLRRGLEDESPAARGSALIALEGLSRNHPGDVNSFRPLLHELAARDPNAAVRRLAIVSLRNGTPQRDTIQILDGIADSDEEEPEVRKTAASVSTLLLKRSRAKEGRGGTATAAATRARFRSFAPPARSGVRGSGVPICAESSVTRVSDAQAPVVGIIMGSRSDWETMRHAAEQLEALGIAFETEVVSAHRTPDKLFEYASSAEARGLQVIVAGAGGAAHLPGMAASKTLLPVLGVPVESKTLQGLDSLLSINQMPAGVPVGTLSIGRAGAVNAALLAAAIVARSDPGVRERLAAFRERQTEAVLAAPDPSA